MSCVALLSAIVVSDRSVSGRKAAAVTDHPAAYRDRVMSIWVVIIHHRLVLMRSISGLQSGLTTQGR